MAAAGRCFLIASSALVRGFRSHDRVLAHLQELDERLTDGAVVFDDEDDG